MSEAVYWSYEEFQEQQRLRRAEVFWSNFRNNRPGYKGLTKFERKQRSAFGRAPIASMLGWAMYKSSVEAAITGHW